MCEPKIDHSQPVDYDIHGLVGVRLVAPSPANVTAVSAQIGPPTAKSLRHPDIVVRYTENVCTGSLRYVDLGKTASSERGLIVFAEGDGKGKVSIPFERIGAECEIFHEGTGVLVTGWIKSGKTEALLAFSQHGATYIGGEWVLLDSTGDNMYGLPGTFRMWDWHRRRLPNGQHIGRNGVMFQLIRFLDVAQQFTPEGWSRFGPLKLLREAMPALRRQLNFRVEPSIIFGDRCKHLTGHPDKIFVGMVHSEEGMRIEPAEPAMVADQLVTAMEFELTSLLSHYRAFKFAFPGMRNDFLENLREHFRSALREALAAKEIYMLYHPYPVSLQDLYLAMQNVLEVAPAAAPHNHVAMPA